MLDRNPCNDEECSLTHNCIKCHLSHNLTHPYIQNERLKREREMTQGRAHDAEEKSTMEETHGHDNPMLQLFNHGSRITLLDVLSPNNISA